MEKKRSHNMGVYEKGFLGVAIRCALLAATIILIGRKILFIFEYNINFLSKVYVV